MPRPAAPFRAERAAYSHHKARAAFEGISWEFTFDTWHAMWIEAGGFNLRGKGRGKYCMARHGDIGPYSPTNVTIKTFGENLSEGFDSSPYLDRQNTVGRIGTGIGGGRGYYFDASHPITPWRSVFRSKSCGRFSTETEARAAYVKAATEYLTRQGKPIPASLT